MHAFLSQRQQKTKVGSTFNKLTNILVFGVPQGSILGPLLFIIYICDFFLNDHLEVGSFVDDTTHFIYGENFDLRNTWCIRKT